jgi:hypothetical protein
MNYVDTAPKGLIAYYEDLRSLPDEAERDSTDVELLRRLLTYDEMREAWRELAKPRYAKLLHARQRVLEAHWVEISPVDEFYEEDPIGFLAFEVFRAAERALHHPPLVLKRTTVRDHFQNIADEARAFSSAIENSALDLDTYRFFPVATLWAFLNYFRPPFVTSGAESMDREADQDPQLEEKWFGEGVEFFITDGMDTPFPSKDRERIFLRGFTEEGLRHWFRKAFEYGMPRMSILANAVADAAEEEARRAKKDPRLLVPKPGDAGAERMYVIRYLAMWFKFWFGGYLRRTLAHIASVTLDDPEVGPDRVDEATKNWKPPERPWRHAPYERQP